VKPCCGVKRLNPTCLRIKPLIFPQFHQMIATLRTVFVWRAEFVIRLCCTAAVS
jgi:hypothetical protein